MFISGLIFKIVIILSLLTFFLKDKKLKAITLTSSILFTAITTFFCFNAFANSEAVSLKLDLLLWTWSGDSYIVIDKFNSIFIILYNVISLIGILYSFKYIENFDSVSTKIHYFALLWLQYSLFFIVVTDNFVNFLTAWEIMTITSFFLIIYDLKPQTIKVGVNYLIQMHVCFFLLLFGFSLMLKYTGSYQISSLANASMFSNHAYLATISLLLLGFGFKAGFIPFHAWLPKAYTTAPSHISGIMSGVMVKMGIFGLLKVLLITQSNLLLLGSVIIIISIITGIYGILQATFQNDIKKLLAYSSIENIGIIGIGIGLFLIGKVYNNVYMQSIALTSVIIHIITHSLVKSFLFFITGNIYKTTHTKNINLMGGLIKKIPATSTMFITGMIALAGLPPLCGFFSKFLIFYTSYSNIFNDNFYKTIILLCVIIALGIISGLSVFAFTKASGIMLLGNKRSNVEYNSKMDNNIYAEVILLSIILIISLLPAVLFNFIFNIVCSVNNIFVEKIYYQNLQEIFIKINIITVIFAAIVTIIYLIRKRFINRNGFEKQATWGCGYTAINEKMQYTSTSMSDNLFDLAKPLIKKNVTNINFKDKEVFPKNKRLDYKTEDYADMFINKLIYFGELIIKKFAVTQTGKIQHYVLYAFIFLIIVFIISFL